MRGEARTNLWKRALFKGLCLAVGQEEDRGYGTSWTGLKLEDVVPYAPHQDSQLVRPRLCLSVCLSVSVCVFRTDLHLKKDKSQKGLTRLLCLNANRTKSEQIATDELFGNIPLLARKIR